MCRCAAIAASMNELAYVLHSGSGVQSQSLLQAAFLANVSGAKLVVPPWLTRAQMGKSLFNMNMIGRSCGRRYEGYHVNAKKQKLAELSSNRLCTLCRNNKLPTLASSLYDLSGIVPSMRDATCDDVCKACTRIDLDVALLSARMNGHCTRNLGCNDTIHALQEARSDRSRSSKRSSPTLCLGPLNAWFFAAGPRTPTERCAASHPLARRLMTRGLPLHPKALSLLHTGGLLGRIGPCARCLYARLSDRDATPEALLKRLHSMPSTALTTILATGASRDQQIEFVSNCAPWDACVEALRQSANTTMHVQLVAHENVTRSGMEVSNALGLPLELGRIAFDQLRCARCQEIVPLDSSEQSSTAACATSKVCRRETSSTKGSARSTFYQQMELMQRELASNEELRNL